MTTSDEDRSFMGTAADAKIGLIEAAQKFRSYRQPRMDTAKGHRQHEAEGREAEHRLSQAALLWLWHEENPTEDPAA